jgi:hypothetical protein
MENGTMKQIIQSTRFSQINPRSGALTGHFSNDGTKAEISAPIKPASPARRGFSENEDSPKVESNFRNRETTRRRRVRRRVSFSFVMTRNGNNGRLNQQPVGAVFCKRMEKSKRNLPLAESRALR